MSREVISDKSAIRLVILFIFGSSLILPTASQAGSDLWLASLTAIIMVMPILLIYSRILSLYPGQDLFDILIIIFGKILGKFLCICFTWFAFHLGVLVTRNFGEYIITVSFPETPMILPMLFLGVLCSWVVKEGIEVLARWSNLFFILNAPAPTLVILSLISEIDFNNILPILYSGYKPFLEGAYSAFSFPFAETIVFTMVFFCLQSEKSASKVLLKGVLISGIPLAVISLVEVLVLGPDIYNFTFYPNHSVATKVKVGNFIEKLEILVIIAALTGGFVKISVCLLAASNGVAKIFGIRNYKSIVFPLGLLMVNFSYFIYDSVIEQVSWASSIWPIYALPFQVILPLVIWAIIELKRRYIHRDLGGVNNG